MIVPTADLYEIAYGKYAIGAYNVNNLEQVLGLFRGCIDSQAPFIIQLSRGARQYADKRMLEALIRTAKDIWPEAMFAASRFGSVLSKAQVYLTLSSQAACLKNSKRLIFFRALSAVPNLLSKIEY